MQSEMGTHRVLVIGAGGREHAIAWHLARSQKCSGVYVAPGNGGTAGCRKCHNVPHVDGSDAQSVIDLCRSNDIDLVVVGPELPLACGLCDQLRAAKIACFGPSAVAAQIEASKSFSKKFMRRHGMPTARFEVFTDVEKAREFIDSSHLRSAPFPALVVKASGLCGGKGVVVAENREQAKLAAADILANNRFGAAGAEIVVEELLEGFEVSVQCFTDGHCVRLVPPAVDHKRVLEGDRGPNTGGMGAFAPAHLLQPTQMQRVRHMLHTVVQQLALEGAPFTGVLYAGLMVSADGRINILEFNARLGDPETQVILPLLKSPLMDIVLACAQPYNPASDGESALSRVPVQWRSDTFACDIVVASHGYPLRVETGHPIAFQCDDLEVAGDLYGDEVIYFHAGTTFEDGQLVTNGGRVMNAVGLGSSLFEARQKALKAAAGVKFEQAFFRRDIAAKYERKAAIASLTYEMSGVSVSKGESLVGRIKSICAATRVPGCDAALGGFGALFDLSAANFTQPVLVMGADGVGTKLQIATECGKFDTIGFDLVAMCVNDILCHGARPLAFLDYYVTGSLHVEHAATVIEGIASACSLAGCALVGGETAEMPQVYGAQQWDVAGFAVGAYDKLDMPHGPLPRADSMAAGCEVLVLPSSGVHSNGFSLVRKVLASLKLNCSSPCPWDNTCTIGDALLEPTRLYTDAIGAVLRSSAAHELLAMAHVTGGGLAHNLARVLPPALAARVDATNWPVPRVFRWLRDAGNICTEEMQGTFNCGAGMALVCAPGAGAKIARVIWHHANMRCYAAGHIVERKEGLPAVEVSNLDAALDGRSVDGSFEVTNGHIANGHAADGNVKKRLAVLVSGTGTNLQAIIDFANQHPGECGYEVVLVICNVPGATAIQIAEKHGIRTTVLPHESYSTRHEFDMALHSELCEWDAQLVALAGFMRILTANFVSLWRGRLVNTHPALLPAFKGKHAIEAALMAGVRFTGCTVHFVEAEVDSGAIVEQGVCRVAQGDTAHSLALRIKALEHSIYPRAIDALAKGNVKYSAAGVQ